MNLINKSKLLSLALTIFSLSFVACDSDDEVITASNDKGSARFEITDAPIDDANVQAAFVTIADLKVNGQSIEGFNKTTLDIKALHSGKTALLAVANIDAKSYSSVTLVLDYNTDANGNSPGCYVAKANGTKEALIASTNEIVINHNFEAMANQQSNMVIDFDLRKSIRRTQSGGYAFASTRAEMENAVRVTNKNSVGIIQGKCENAMSNGDKVVVYAYKKGTFNKDMETSGQGQSNIEFANAVTSATVDGSGNYSLHFLEEGDYELKFISYKKNTSNNQMELQGMLSLSLVGNLGLNLNAVSVNAATSTTVNVSVSGILPL